MKLILGDTVLADVPNDVAHKLLDMLGDDHKLDFPTVWIRTRGPDYEQSLTAPNISLIPPPSHVEVSIKFDVLHRPAEKAQPVKAATLLPAPVPSNWHIARFTEGGPVKVADIVLEHPGIEDWLSTARDRGLIRMPRKRKPGEDRRIEITERGRQHLHGYSRPVDTVKSSRYNVEFRDRIDKLIPHFLNSEMRDREDRLHKEIVWAIWFRYINGGFLYDESAMNPDSRSVIPSPDKVVVRLNIQTIYAGTTKGVVSRISFRHE